MTDEKIKHMVNRFLGWKLPENFNPDGGISFKKTFNEHTAYPMKNEPTGTNLFDASQATSMVQHMIEGMPVSLSVNAVKSDDFRWLIEAPGQHYLASRKLGCHEFYWTQDHNAALAFRSEEQADALMMAVRQMDREIDQHRGSPFAASLFGFEGSLGSAKAIEHGWMDSPEQSAERYGKRLGEMLQGAAERICDDTGNATEAQITRFSLRAGLKSWAARRLELEPNGRRSKS